ncbi:MAG: dethiobiotin synthase [Gammaproteobacteria bacterium]|nr:dethiobiotin synthase [Gammaproteobacteria bacterium]
MVGGYFVTGTDTGVGKTEISLGLMEVLRQEGWSVLGMKPVAAGCEWRHGRLVNEDALRILQLCSRPLAYGQVNPYALEPAIAPHLAAAEAGVELAFDPILQSFNSLKEQAEWLIVEGAGGWRVPLGEDGDMAELAWSLGLPVILVVGMRLGCLNHAVLTAESIADFGPHFAGWVANCIDPDMPYLEENISSLKQLIDAPCLGVVDWMKQPTPAAIAKFLSEE